MRNLEKACDNKAVITGKLIHAEVNEGVSKASNSPYASAKMSVRVAQEYGDVKEVSELGITDFASKFSKRDNSITSHYNSIENMRNARTVQKNGFEDADVININGSLQERVYVTRMGTISSEGYDVRPGFNPASFASGAQNQAVFNTEMYIISTKEEMDKEEALTGRLVVRGAIVQWGGKVDVLSFIIENPQSAQAFMSRFQEGDTVRVWGFIRATVKREKQVPTEESWGGGNTLPTVTITTKELIITGGNPSPNDEDNSYDPEAIKEGLQEREARIEKMREKQNKPRVEEKVYAVNAPWADTDTSNFTL